MILSRLDLEFVVIRHRKVIHSPLNLPKENFSTSQHKGWRKGNGIVEILTKFLKNREKSLSLSGHPLLDEASPIE